jgi:hypothetical protein
MGSVAQRRAVSSVDRQVRRHPVAQNLGCFSVGTQLLAYGNRHPFRCSRVYSRRRCRTVPRDIGFVLRPPVTKHAHQRAQGLTIFGQGIFHAQRHLLKMCRATMPSRSSSRRCCVSIFLVIPGIIRCNSRKRRTPPSLRCHRITGFHFPPITARVTSTGQWFAVRSVTFM